MIPRHTCHPTTSPVFLVGLGVALLMACGSANRNDGPATLEHASVEEEQAASLLERARAERDQGRIAGALETYQRATSIAGTSLDETVLRDVLAVIDGLQIEAVTGDRQVAAIGRPPEQALQARIFLDSGNRRIPAAGTPIVVKWATGDGDVTGERSSDGSGLVTLRVTRIHRPGPARLDLGVDVGGLGLRFGEPGDPTSRLLEDAVQALDRRRASFDFLPPGVDVTSRVLVLIEETVLDRPAEESLISDRLTTALVDRGVKVVGVSEIGKSNYEKIEQSLDRGALDAVRLEYYNLCDYILYGRIQVRKDYVNEGGGKWCVARGRVSLYSLRSPEIVASADLSDVGALGGPDQPWIQAAEQALRKSAEIVEQKLIPMIVQRMGG